MYFLLAVSQRLFKYENLGRWPVLNLPSCPGEISTWWNLNEHWEGRQHVFLLTDAAQREGITLSIPPSGTGGYDLHWFKYFEMLPGQERRDASKYPFKETTSIGILVTIDANLHLFYLFYSKPHLLSSNSSILNSGTLTAKTTQCILNPLCPLKLNFWSWSKDIFV